LYFALVNTGHIYIIFRKKHKKTSSISFSLLIIPPTFRSLSLSFSAKEEEEEEEERGERRGLGCVRVCIRNASQVQRTPSQRIAALVDVYVCVFFSLAFFGFSGLACFSVPSLVHISLGVGVT
jgi:hypothetical protein